MTGVWGPTVAPFQGRAAERHVGELLQGAGWVVLDRNLRADGGELDLVVERRGVVRFVEVKARSCDGRDGLESVGADKQRRLRRAAERWLAERGAPRVEAAFLVALVALDRVGWPVEWWDDPF